MGQSIPGLPIFGSTELKEIKALGKILNTYAKAGNVLRYNEVLDRLKVLGTAVKNDAQPESQG